MWENRRDQGCLRLPARHVVGAVACLWTACACKDFEPTEPTAAISASDASPTSPTGETPTAHEPKPAVDAGGAAMPRGAWAPARASQNYVVVPNPSDHSVAFVDARTLKTIHATCKGALTLASSTTEGDVALVVDVRDRTGCVLRPVDGDVQSVAIDVVPNVNRIDVAPGAHFALAYYDPDSHHPDQDPYIAEELSVVALDADNVQASNVVVGLRPRGVRLTDDGRRAFVMSDGGISAIDLDEAASGRVTSVAPLSFDPGLWLNHAIVRIAPQALQAIAFETDAGVLYALDLRSGDTRTVDLSAWVESSDAGVEGGIISNPRIADAVLLHDGTAVWVALRGEQTLLRVALPKSNGEIASVERLELGGQPTDRLELVGADDTALFVTSTKGADTRATLVSLSDLDRRAVPLARAVDRVLTSEDREALVLQHDASDTEPNGYTLLRVRDGIARFRQTEVAPAALEISSAAGVVAAIIPGFTDLAPGLQLLELETLGLYVEPLDSSPQAVGFVGDGRFAFAQQEHPDGRLTFVELESRAHRTLTGFLIAQRVEE